MPTQKQKLGCWFRERWKAELLLNAPTITTRLGYGWKELCNRHEQIEIDPVSGGRICHWQDSSPLTVARFFPSVGGRFLHHCLHEWPVNFQTQANASSAVPEVSFVLGVRGTGRLPQFLATVASLLGQTDCDTEVIVVEQSWKQEFTDIVPKYVRYVHTQATCEQMPYNRSWALNVGAQQAKGRVLVLHDSDFVVPSHFARAVADTVSGAVEAARLPRYKFFVDQATSERIQSQRSFQSVRTVEHIAQNCTTPMAVTREACLRIGGHDEAFYGWGAEDNEFLDRVRTLVHCEGGFLPVIHLWHHEAPNRSGDRNADVLKTIMSDMAAERIRKLVARPFGQTTPSVQWLAKPLCR